MTEDRSAAGGDQAAMEYAPFRKNPDACPDCIGGVQCVACRFAGRPPPRVQKYPGRLADTKFMITTGAPKGSPREEDEDMR